MQGAIANNPVSHKQRVMRLYRQGLKALQSWVIDREVWNDKAIELRARFDSLAYLDVTDR